MANLQPVPAANRREADRRTALDDYLCLVDLGESRSAMLLDVSETGIGVQCVDGVSEGSATAFRFQLPDTAVLIEGEGEIAWVDRAGRMGIRFTKLADELKPELRKWVASEANPLFAHQVQTEEVAELDARDRVAQMEARIIVSGWAQVQALNFLVDQIAAMTQASGVAIAVEDGTGIVCKASSGIAPEAGVRVNPRSGLSWECLRSKDVVHCVDTETDPRVDRAVCRQLNMRSAMLVPVLKDGSVMGLVEVFASRPRAFSNQTVILLRRVAEAVASLDETAAPDIFEQPQAIIPPAASPLPPPPNVPAAPEPEPRMQDTKPAESARPVVVKPEPQPVPVVAKPEPQPVPVVVKPEPQPVPAVVKPEPQTVPAAAVEPRVEVPPAAPVAVKPASVASAAPAPAINPEPAKPVVEATKLGVPFAQAMAQTSAQEVAPINIEVKPAEPLPAKPVEKPAPVAVAPVAPAPVAPVPVEPPARKKETKAPETKAPQGKLVEPPAPRAVEKKAPEKASPPPKPVTVKEPDRVVPPVLAAPSLVQEKPQKPAPATKIEKPTTVIEKAPAPVRVVPKPAPLPEGGFMGAAAAAAPAKTSEFTIPTSDESSARPSLEQINEIWHAAVATEASAATRKRYIGIAAAAVISVSALGGWYLARTASEPKSAAVAQPANSPANPPASVHTTVPVAENLPLAAAATPSSTTAVKPPVSGESKKPSAPRNDAATSTPTDTTTVPDSNPVHTAGSASTAAQDIPAAPLIALPSSNSAGVASLLAAPVAAPTLARTNVSQGVTGGKQILRVQPVYPSTARALHLAGTVTLSVHISKTGQVTDVKVVKGHPLLNAAATDAVKQWKYEPFMLNGQPIENDINVQVRFEMPR